MDDEEDIVTLFTKVMQENGYLVMGFTSSLFFLDYIREHPDKFSFLIVDYRMFPMQGSELANKL